LCDSSYKIYDLGKQLHVKQSKYCIVYTPNFTYQMTSVKSYMNN